MDDRVRERFNAKVRVEPNGCHTWTGYVRHNGYGSFWYQGQTQVAHRFAWFLHYGEWPPAWPASGLVLDHQCFNPTCVNVEHLRLVTAQENIKTHHKARRTRDIRAAKGQHCECCALTEWSPEQLQYIHYEDSSQLFEKRVQQAVEVRTQALIDSQPKGMELKDFTVHELRAELSRRAARHERRIGAA